MVLFALVDLCDMFLMVVVPVFFGGALPENDGTYVLFSENGGRGKEVKKQDHVISLEFKQLSRGYPHGMSYDTSDIIGSKKLAELESFIRLFWDTYPLLNIIPGFGHGFQWDSWGAQ